MNRPAILAAIILAAHASAHAATAPKPGSIDPRIRQVRYDPEQVVLLKGYLGFQFVLTFAPDERIENVSIGDAMAWQVTPNHKANLLFLKPLDADAQTNMTVVTDRRRYAFDLRAGHMEPRRAPADIAYEVRFTYPEPPAQPPGPPPPPKTPPQRKNVAYTYTGSRTALPSVVFDDGRFTYFQWPETVAVPALFSVGGDGSESLVNYGVRDGFVVVEQIARRFVLRDGKESTVVINDGWREPAPEPTAPKPHDSKTARDAEKMRSGL